MAKQIAKLLKADLNASSDLALIAKMLEKKGRANDTILAHITEREAQILKQMGGAGTVNPETGLLEFYDGYDYVPAETYAIAPQPQIEMTPLPPMESQPYVRSSADNQALYGNYGYAGEQPAAAPFVDTAAGTRSMPGGEAVSQVPAEYSGSGLTPGGYYGLTPSQASYGMTATPAQAAAFGPAPIPEYKPGYGITDTMTPAAAAAPPEATKPAEKSWWDKLSTDQLVRLGLTGGLGLFGAQKSKEAAKQGQQAAEEQKALGAPYQQKGTELQRAAAAGELTPAGQQSMQALQARLAQGAEARGGVGAAQAAAQLEAYRQQLLQGQFDYGIKVSQIGDSIALGAIRTGMQADQQLNQANTAFYTNLAMIGAGVPMRTS